jgi:hypothetical protein
MFDCVICDISSDCPTLISNPRIIPHTEKTPKLPLQPIPHHYARGAALHWRKPFLFKALITPLRRKRSR